MYGIEGSIPLWSHYLLRAFVRVCGKRESPFKEDKNNTRYNVPTHSNFPYKAIVLHTTKHYGDSSINKHTTELQVGGGYEVEIQ